MLILNIPIDLYEIAQRALEVADLGTAMGGDQYCFTYAFADEAERTRAIAAIKTEVGKVIDEGVGTWE
jgi:hypothetical protein